MQRSSLKQIAINNYKSNALASWILGISTGFLIAAIISIDIIVPCISLITFPLLILPILFSSTLQHVFFKANQQVTFKSSIKSFSLYFNRKYSGSFSYLFNFLKSLIVFFVTEMVVSTIASSILTLVNSDFVQAAEDLYNLIYSSESYSYSDLMNALHANGNILYIYIGISLGPALFLAIIFLIYNLSRYSIMIYYRMRSRDMNKNFVRSVYNFSLRGHRREAFKNYMSLNWPLFVLLVVGLIGGGIGGYFVSDSIFSILSFALLGAAVLSTFFLPFYFSNQEALFEIQSPSLISGTKEVMEMLLKRMQEDIRFSQEQKDRFEQEMRDSNGEENKKGPDGP